MKLYFDTNVLRDYLENRNPKSIELIELARQKEWESVTSAFAMMELSDLQKDTLYFQKTVVSKKWDVDRFLRERKQKQLGEADFKDLEAYMSLIESRLPFITYFNLASEDGWQIASHIASHSGLSAVDSIHLATAYTVQSDRVVTNDQQFIKSGNEILKSSKRAASIKICTPEQVLKEINSPSK